MLANVPRQKLSYSVIVFPNLGKSRRYFSKGGWKRSVGFSSIFFSSVVQCPTGCGLMDLNYERNRNECLEGCIEME